MRSTAQTLRLGLGYCIERDETDVTVAGMVLMLENFHARGYDEEEAQKRKKISARVVSLARRE